MLKRPLRSSRRAQLAGIALLGAVFSAAPPAVLAQRSAAAPVVHISDGALEGASDNGIASFKNIPFAAPPVGALRWRPPLPVAPWSGVREAKAVGPVCEQIYNAKDTGVGPLPMSEDCLQLNVWTPDVAAAKGKAPVMVWIHGGGHVNGSGTAALYDGANLAKQGVVVVTLNYRLGRLGFFAHPALDAEHPDELKANYGLMDTIAALKWVKANIAKFGGDPGNVTVFGESAGGISVTYLMVSPMAKGLFQKAVVESGAGREHGAALKGADRYGIRSAEATGLAFAEANGITDAATGAAALRALPADVLMKAAPSSADGGGPIIDGKLFSEDPEQGFAAGHQMKIPFLIGSNSLEWPIPPGAAGAMGSAIAPVAAHHDEAVTAFGSEAAYNERVISDTVFTEPAHYLAVNSREEGRAGMALSLLLPVGFGEGQTERRAARIRAQICVRHGERDRMAGEREGRDRRAADEPLLDQFRQDRQSEQCEPAALAEVFRQGRHAARLHGRLNRRGRTDAGQSRERVSRIAPQIAANHSKI